MKVRVYCLVLLLCLLAASVAQAGIYTLPTAINGYCASGGTIDFDFGRSFSSINRVSVSWSGQLVAGELELVSFPYTRVPYYGSLVADILDDDNHAVAYTKTSMSGMAATEPFYQINQFGMYGSSSWDFLLDGRAKLQTRVAGQYYACIYREVSRPSANLTSVTLIIDATPVPEPSGLLFLVSGMIGMRIKVNRAGILYIIGRKMR